MPTTQPSLSTEAAFAQFSRVLAKDGARAALADLVLRTDYRFIGIFRFQDGKANAAIYFDRENPGMLRTQEVPDTATYCCYVRDERGLFATADSIADERLTQHPARTQVRAYCGVPILNPEGVLLGSLCHYDLEPRDPTQLDLDLLLQVASALQQGHHVPPYPTA